MAIRLLLVDDHPVVRAGLHGMLAHQPDFVIVGEGVNGEEALTLCAIHQPDVILLDLRMPVMDGLSALRQLREKYPAVQVLILTTYDSDQDIVAAVHAGAVGYLLKDAPREDLYQAIRAAARGESVLNPTVAARLMQHIRTPEANKLTEREVAVLRHVSEGLTNKQIGKALFISEATVKTHLIHIFDKLNVPDRAAAVRTAIEQGILQV
ncbi:MAG: response regulator transcription factor [Anaerolineae bacterium]